jgi:hypothetical protein
MATQSARGVHPLTPHPASPAAAVHALTVDIARPSDDRLSLEFKLRGEIEQLRFPEPRAPQRADGLWRHTCFEAFIGQAEGRAYWEYNFSPSGAWATYQFAGYREAMSALLKGAAPVIDVAVTADTLSLSVIVDLAWLARSTASPLKLAAAAVIEDRARGLSYWALKHPAEKPDFHHADGFVVPLD